MSDPAFNDPESDPAFNDPETWGYCERCAFICTVNPATGLLGEHRRTRNGQDTNICSGSHKPPTIEVPNTATAREVVDLRKNMHRARQRAYWYKRRRSERDAVVPDTVVITNTETGDLHVGGDDGEDDND